MHQLKSYVLIFSETSYKKLIDYRDYFLEEDRKIEEAASEAKCKAPGILGRVGAWVGLGE